MFVLSDFFEPIDIVREGSFCKVMHPATIEAGSLCFVKETRFLRVVLDNPNVTAVITNAAIAPLIDKQIGIVIADDPQKAYYDLHNHLVVNGKVVLHHEHFIHESAHVASSAVIGRNVVIHEGVTIGEFAVIGDYTIIGAHTRVDPYVVTAVRGLQDFRIDGRIYPVAYAGGVKIGARCEVLTGAIIQRSFRPEYTVIGDDTQISVRVVVGHGSRVGNHVMISGNTQIAGEVMIGDKVWIGPSVTVAQRIKINDNARVLLGSVVIDDVATGKTVSGNFALPHIARLREHTRIRNGNT